MLFPLIVAVVLLSAGKSTAGKKDFRSWLQELRTEGLQSGLSPNTLDNALAGLQPLEWVLQLQRRQPEQILTLEEYTAGVLPRSRRRLAIASLHEHRDLLARVATDYRVQARYIVALWAIESDFGRNMGKTPVIDALATLAHGGRRAQYFRKELFCALHILQDEGLPAKNLLGSWAGAMGQCQFMPWNFLNRAVDYDRDGTRDIWENPADVFASIANYLQHTGWRDDETWGRQVIAPPEVQQQYSGLERRLSLQEWEALGVRRLNGQPLPKRDISAALIRPEPGIGRTYLVYNNFRALLRWNNSQFFAVAVGILSDSINSG